MTWQGNGLLNVSPRFPGDDHPDKSAADSELGGELLRDGLAKFMRGPDKLDSFGGKLGVRLPFPTAMPVLGDHVRRVVGRRPEEHVIDVLTKLVVAPMADHHSVRDRAADKFPRNAVSKQCAGASRDATVAGPDAACPGDTPRFSWRSELGREPYGEWDGSAGDTTGGRAGLGLAQFDISRLGEEPLAALLADARDSFPTLGNSHDLPSSQGGLAVRVGRQVALPADSLIVVG